MNEQLLRKGKRNMILGVILAVIGTVMECLSQMVISQVWSESIKDRLEATWSINEAYMSIDHATLAVFGLMFLWGLVLIGLGFIRILLWKKQELESKNKEEKGEVK